MNIVGEDLTQAMVLRLALQFVAVVVAYYAGRWAARAVRRALEHVLVGAQFDQPRVVVLGKAAYYGTLGAIMLLVLGMIGITSPTTTTVLTVLVIALGFALQNWLSDLSSGLFLAIFRPLRDGDWVTVKGTSGIVQHVQIVATTIRTFDNQLVTIPNSLLTTEPIANFSLLGQLRVDLTIPIDRAADVRRATAVIGALLDAEPRVLAEPAPQIGVLDVTDSSLVLAVRPWVQSEDLLAVRLALNERIVVALEAAGIGPPAARREVRLRPDETADDGRAPAQALPEDHAANGALD